MTDALTLALACAEAADNKKAEDVTILDMSGISSFTDYFVICSGSSEPQLKAIGSEIRESLREKYSVRPLSEEGFPASQWVVLDYGDVIIHLFHSEKRAHYSLESLWSDAKRVEWSPSPPKPAA